MFLEDIGDLYGKVVGGTPADEDVAVHGIVKEMWVYNMIELGRFIL